MKFNKMIIILAFCLILVFSSHPVYAVECTGPTPTGNDNYIHCVNEDDTADENDNGVDDIAEITRGDNCLVTCTDPTDSGKTYILHAYGTSTVIDKTDDDVNIKGTVEYYDSKDVDKIETLYTIDDDDTQEKNEGIVAMFGPQSDGNGILKKHNFDDHYKRAIKHAPSRLWSLFFSSFLHWFKSGDNNVGIEYTHKLDYTICEDTYIELYLCADAKTRGTGDRICPYTEDTAFTICIMHQDGKKSSIISVDSEGNYKGGLEGQ